MESIPQSPPARASSTIGAHNVPAANPWLPHVAVIEEITPESPGVSTYRLRLRDPAVAADYRFQPGQFNMLYVPGAGESAISLSADPQGTNRLHHTIRAAGNVTRALAAMQPGDSLGLRGPFGSSWPLAADSDVHIVLVAGGIGLAPLRPAICELLARRDEFRQLTLLYGSRTRETMIFQREFDDWRRRGLDVQLTVDFSTPGWKENVGPAPLLLDRLPLADPSATRILICGPEVMMRYCLKTALDRGISAENLWISSERNMQCAVGLCGHCQWGPMFVCKDGPVFRYDRIARFLSVEAL